MKINNNYSIDKNGTLIFQEMREVKKLDGTKTNELFTDRWYFSNTKDALKKYCQLALLESEDVKDCLKRIDELTNVIINLEL